jgi:leucyl/phenylalanyl-tRNA--protein transferase
VNSLRLPCLGDFENAPFPPTATALTHPNGLLAWGGDLEPGRLLNAYKQGIFPWYSDDDPILWWSPAPRCVIYPADIYTSTRTRRRFNSGKYHITADTAFEQVIEACSEPRKDDSGTWITDEMQQAYKRLHRQGHAHSVEVWKNKKLVGGVYGIAIGKVFFGESMFSRETDTSKIALISLCQQLQAWQYGLMDCQVENPHLMSLGAVEISRSVFESSLMKYIDNEAPTGSWKNRFSVRARW